MLLGPPQPSPQPPPEFAGRGDAGPRARAQLRGAPNFGLVPAGSGLRARRGPRGAARMDGRARGRSGGGGGDRAGRVPAAGLRAERAGPGRRARSHPRRGPRAQRRALGGPARGPRSMLPPPAAALLLAGAPPGAAPSAALRLPPRAESLRAQLSLPSPCGSGVAASVFSARVAAFSLCASEADPGCPFPPALSLRGRKQTRQRSEAPVHTCAGGRCQALLHLPNSHRSNSVTPPERHLVPLGFAARISASSNAKSNANTF